MFKQNFCNAARANKCQILRVGSSHFLRSLIDAVVNTTLDVSRQYIRADLGITCSASAALPSVRLTQWMTLHREFAPVFLSMGCTIY